MAITNRKDYDRYRPHLTDLLGKIKEEYRKAKEECVGKCCLFPHVMPGLAESIETAEQYRHLVRIVEEHIDELDEEWRQLDSIEYKETEKTDNKEKS